MEGNRSNGNGNGNGHGPASRVERPAANVRRVTVLGGAGFVGSVLIPKLLSRGYDVTVLDAFLYGTDSFNGCSASPRLELIRGDIRSVESVIRACLGADAIVHLGGLVGDPSCALDEELTREINLKSTAMIAEAARGLGIARLVFASSCAVYGASDGLLDEDAPLEPVSLYAHTKAESERLLLGLAGPEFCPTVLRFGTFYGLSPRPRFDLVVNLLAARAVREQEITIFGGGQWRPFIHVDDGAEAIMTCLEGPLDRVAAEAFNVGCEQQNRTLGQVAELIGELVPDVRVTFEPAAATEANYRVSFRKIRGRLGFEPRRTLVDGILEIKVAVESDAVGDYREARYDNHKSLASGETAGLLEQIASTAAPSPL